MSSLKNKSPLINTEGKALQEYRNPFSFVFLSGLQSFWFTDFYNMWKCFSEEQENDLDIYGATLLVILI